MTMCHSQKTPSYKQFCKKNFRSVHFAKEKWNAGIKWVKEIGKEENMLKKW